MKKFITSFLIISFLLLETYFFYKGVRYEDDMRDNKIQAYTEGLNKGFERGLDAGYEKQTKEMDSLIYVLKQN